MPFSFYTSIKFHQTDMAGIAFYGSVFSLAHDAYEELVAKGLGFNKADWFKNSEWILPIKKTEAEYIAPLLPFSEIKISIDVSEIGKSSFVLNYDISSQGLSCIKLKTIHVFCNKNNFQKINIPEQILEKLNLFRSAQ